jgi:hypothetical protein
MEVLMRRTMLAGLLGLSVLVFQSVPATASFHLVKIVEVFPGTTSDPAAQYVVLQAYFAGQNFVARHSLTVFDATGTQVGTFTFGSNVSNGANLATMLIATASAQDLFGINADLTMTPAIQPGGGAVCWDVFDCVAWGSFDAANLLPRPPGTPFNAPDGLLLDMAMHRDLSGGGAVTGFAFAPPAPRNNAGQSGTLGPTPTPSATPTPTVPPSVSPCPGDCNDDLVVKVDEIIILVDIALGNTSIPPCDAGDLNHDNKITVNEILAAVNRALNGCGVG